MSDASGGGVIAGVWAPPHARDQASALRAALLREAPPRLELSGGGGLLLGWGPVTLDREGACVWLGDRVLDGTSGSSGAPLGREAARGLRGTHGLIGLGAEGLVISRGALGARPVYYARIGELVVACSRLALLTAVLPGSARLDADRLATMACGLSHSDPAATPFVGVSRLAPRETLLFHARGIERVRARTPRLDELAGVTPEAAAEELWGRIQALVGRATEGASVVGVMAGGGIDSSGLLAAAVAGARGASRREVVAIALDFAARGDDRPYLVDLARALGLVPLRLDPAAAAPWVVESLVADGSPYVRSSGPLEQLVLRTARARGVDVLLAGAGGDDLFRADPRALALEAETRPLVAVRRAATLEVPWPSTVRSRLADFVLRPALAERLPAALLRRWRSRTQALGQRWAGPRVRVVLARSAAVPPVRLPRSPGERYQRLACDPWLCDASDGWEALQAATGMRRVYPYLDDELLAFVAQIPILTMSHGGRDRALLRMALRTAGVPESICARSDKAWFEPAFAAAVIAHGGFARLRHLAFAPRLAALGIVDPSAFLAAFDALARAPIEGAAPQLWEQVWPVLAVEAFAARCGVSA